MIQFIRVLNCLEEAKDLEIYLREEKRLNNFLKIFVRIGLVCDRIEKFINEINITNNRRGLRK